MSQKNEFPRLVCLGKYARDRYTDVPQKHAAQLEAQMQAIAAEEQEKLGGPFDFLKSIGSSIFGGGSSAQAAPAATPKPAAPAATPKPAASPIVQKAKTQGAKGFGQAASSEGPLLRFMKNMTGFGSTEKSFVDKTTVKKPKP